MGEVFQVFLRGLTGKIHTVDVATSQEAFDKTTGQQFRKLLGSKIEKEEHLTNLDPNDLRLIFQTKQLEDNTTFEAYNITPKSTVYMVFGLPGGCHLNAYFPTQAGVNSVMN